LLSNIVKADLLIPGFQAFFGFKAGYIQPFANKVIVFAMNSFINNLIFKIKPILTLFWCNTCFEVSEELYNSTTFNLSGVRDSGRVAE
jgi:hypothetical protein